jgi:hypothetical protein
MVLKYSHGRDIFIFLLPTDKIYGYMYRLPQYNVYVLLLISILLLVIATLLVYFDARTALRALYLREKHTVLSKGIAGWLWQDLTNAYGYNWIYWLPSIIARIVFWGFIIKYIIVALLICVTELMKYDIPSLKSLIQPLIDLLMNHDTGVLVLSYSIVYLIAERLHKFEQAFNVDYAVMQKQR